VQFFALPTEVALDVAAPDEAAVALLFGVDPARLVTASAAHQTAAVDGLRRLVARPVLGSQHTQRLIAFAVVGRFVEEDEILAGGLLHVLVDDVQLLLFLFQIVGHVVGALEALHQGTADLCKGGHFPPADFHGARSRHSVTFAHQLHPTADRSSASFVVVQVHETFGALGILAGVDEFLAELLTESDVLRASAPFESFGGALADLSVASAFGNFTA